SAPRWLNLATAAAHAEADTFDRTPTHWADTATWVAGELACFNPMPRSLPTPSGPHPDAIADNAAMWSHICRTALPLRIRPVVWASTVGRPRRTARGRAF